MAVRPLPPGPIAHDEQGDPVPQPGASDLEDLIQLLEYGRRKGFRIGPTVRVGRIVTSVRDLRQDEGVDRQLEQDDKSIWEEHEVPAVAPSE